jgi:hypothetical protein
MKKKSIWTFCGVCGIGTKKLWNTETPFAVIDLDKKITEAGLFTELLLAAQTLARTPGGEELARENFQYIVARYPDIRASRQAKVQIQTLYNRRNIQ